MQSQTKTYKARPEFWNLRIKLLITKLKRLILHGKTDFYIDFNIYTLKYLKVDLYKVEVYEEIWPGYDKPRISFNEEEFTKVLLGYDEDDDLTIKQLEQLAIMMK